MDLDYQGREDLSEHLIRTYVEKSGDQDLSLLLDFYKCYRAYVRGKVESFRLDDPNIPEGEKGEPSKGPRARSAKLFSTGPA
jgi:aminoglycoside phosphotransferase family enzyme